MTRRTRRRRAQIWAITGAAVLTLGLGTILLSAIWDLDSSDQGRQTESTSSASSADPSATPTLTPPPQSAKARGWVSEPTTKNADSYVRSAIAAAGTFDTRKSSYSEWISYLGTWFTPDTRYASEADQQTELAAAKLEMRQSVVLPESEWNSLADERGRVASVVTSEVSFISVPNDSSGDMAIGTADVEITYIRTSDAGKEVSYTESARISVQILCGPASVPALHATQAPGDCKVVRFFSEPVGP